MVVRTCWWLLIGVSLLAAYLFVSGASAFHQALSMGVSFGLAIPCILSVLLRNVLTGEDANFHDR